MRKRSGVTIVLLVSAFVMAAVAGCGQSAKQSASTPKAASATKTLKIGMLANVTGWFAPIGTSNVHDVECYAKVLNDQGGVKIGNTTYKIQLVVEDGKSNNADIRAAAIALRDAGCKYVIETNDFWVVGAEDIFEKANIMHLSLYCIGVPGFIGPKNPNAFTATDGAIGDYNTTFQVLKKYYPNVKTAVLAIDDNGSVPALNKQLQADGAKYGIKVLDKYIIFPGNTTDMMALATKVAASGADCWLTQGSITTIGGVLKQLRHSGSNMVCASITGQNAQAIVNACGTDAAANAFDFGLVLSDPNLSPTMKAVVAQVKKDYGAAATASFSGYGVDTMYDLFYVMKKANSIDVKTVEKEWESLNTIDTPNGPAKVTGMKTYGVRHALAVPEPVSLLKKGKIVMGGWVTPDIQ